MGNNILFISYDGMTDPLGQSQVIPYLQGLSKAGYKVTLLSFEKKARYIIQSKLIKSILDESGILWQPLFFTKRPPFLSKVYDVWKLKAKARALHKQHRFSLVHCRSYVPASAGLHLSRKYNVPFLFDMRGFWVDERVDNGQWDLQNPFFKFFYKKYKNKEKAYFTESRHIISLTWKGKQELTDVYDVPEEKITVIPCCVDLAHFDYKKISQDLIDDKRKELGIKPGEKVISYLGSLGGWYLEKEMLDFFIEIKKTIPSLKFLFITQDSCGKVANAAVQSGASEHDILVQPSMRKEKKLHPLQNKGKLWQWESHLFAMI
jgi:glycosyltransferase involved in cell wall biosynthesis